MSVRIFSVNARGLCDMLKRKALVLFCEGKEADFCFIQETYTCQNDALFWKNQWGCDIWFYFTTILLGSFTSNKTADVAILLKRTGFQGSL